MNLFFNLLAVDSTVLIVCCAVIAAVALVGAITCCVLISKHKKHLKESDEKPVEKAPAPVKESVVKEVKEEPSEAEKEEISADVAHFEETPADEEDEYKPETAEEVKEDELEAEIEAQDEADEEEEDNALTEVAPVIPETPPEGKIFIRVRYNRSYTAKLIQSGDVLKSYYTEIKNELMRYGVSNRISWKHETFRSGRKLLVRLAIRGKTLCVYFALNPADYADTKFKLLDVSHVAKNAAVPALYKIKNDRRVKYCKQLIAELMQANGLAEGEEQSVNYAAQYPYEELEPLIDKKLVKLLPWKEFVPDSEVGVIAVSKDNIPAELLVGNVSVTEADDMFIGENVEALVEQSARISDKTKKEIINIDTLGKYFENGERVTLEEIKKRIPAINKRATYIKILARGTLDKALIVEADDYSPAAIKMLVITGGKAVISKRG